MYVVWGYGTYVRLYGRENRKRNGRPMSAATDSWPSTLFGLPLLPKPPSFAWSLCSSIYPKNLRPIRVCITFMYYFSFLRRRPLLYELKVIILPCLWFYFYALVTVMHTQRDPLETEPIHIHRKSGQWISLEQTNRTFFQMLRTTFVCRSKWLTHSFPPVVDFYHCTNVDKLCDADDHIK